MFVTHAAADSSVRRGLASAALAPTAIVFTWPTLDQFPKPNLDTLQATKAAVHDSMSVILDPDSYDLWLDPGMKDVGAASEGRIYRKG
jgi:hypothetical protein